MAPTETIKINEDTIVNALTSLVLRINIGDWYGGHVRQ